MEPTENQKVVTGIFLAPLIPDFERTLQVGYPVHKIGTYARIKDNTLQCPEDFRKFFASKGWYVSDCQDPKVIEGAKPDNPVTGRHTLFKLNIAGLETFALLSIQSEPMFEVL